MKKSAEKNGYTLLTITTKDELTNILNTQPTSKNCPGISNLEYFGHSSKDGLFLEYSSVEDGQATDIWNMDDFNKIDRKRLNFESDCKQSKFASYGCYSGKIGGMSEEIGKLIPSTGAEGKTDYGPIGQGETFPSGFFKKFFPNLE